MKSEYRGILAIALSAAFFILWYTVISPPPKKVEPQQPAKTEELQSAAEANPSQKVDTKQGEAKKEESSARDPQEKLAIKTWTIKNSLVQVMLTNEGAVPTSWKILGYTEGVDKNSPQIDMVEKDSETVPPLLLSLDGQGVTIPKRPRFELFKADETSASFKWRSNDIELIKTISLANDSYLAEVSFDIKNLTTRPLELAAGLEFSGVNLPQKKGGFLSFLKQTPSDNKIPVYYLDGKVHRESNVAKIGEEATKKGQVLWSGLESRYFLGAVIPRVQGEGMAVEFGSSVVPEAPLGTNALWAGAKLPKISIPSGDTVKSGFSVYVGPKEMERLKVAQVKLEEAIDYGWFTVVAIPILYLLKFFYNIVHNYGIAIILLTIFVKLLLHPINVKSLKSMKAMQQLQPKLKELQKKYANDKQRLNQEMMQMYRSHKVNPMGGCLPMLLQFPIYIALYKVLWNSIELYHAPFFWFYRDLSAPDPYFITPILLGVFMVLQQKLMPSTSADPAQQKMMMIMPIMFSVFMLFLPVGLVIYILINTAMSVTQQNMYNKGIGFADLIRRGFKR